MLTRCKNNSNGIYLCSPVPSIWMIKKQSGLKNKKCILTRKKTLDAGASVFGKTMKRTKHSAVSLMTVVALVRWSYDKNLSNRSSDPIQSNPIHGWIQSMSNSDIHNINLESGHRFTHTHLPVFFHKVIFVVCVYVHSTPLAVSGHWNNRPRWCITVFGCVTGSFCWRSLGCHH